MRAVRGNKEYTISDSQSGIYRDSGYDIVDDENKVIAYGKGKTVPYGDYIALKQENESLKAELEKMQASDKNQGKKKGD